MSAASIHPNIPALQMVAVTVGAREDLRIAVLEDVHWSVAPGDYWVIGGMNNSGKSDLLALAAGLTPAQRGSYRLFGHDMPGEVGGQERLRVGLVFDGGKPFHQLTIEENVMLPLRYHRAAGESEPAERAREIMELTGLSPWAGRMPGTIGRAWEKRLGLARALVLQPEVLLLDDPLGGLDARHIDWWLNFLEKLSAGHPYLHGRPMTLAIAAHNLQPWRDKSVWLAVLQNKRFAPLGRCSELSSVAEPLVHELLLEKRRTEPSV
jgi:ABC-type transporter Mla maintaining outer membrane lipid asymmetry ATPase subunit MlaF